MAEKIHAKLSPSGAHRWMACPASVKLEDGMPNTSSAAADEGTLAHDWAAYLLDPEQPMPQEELSEEMAKYVGYYVDAVRDAVRNSGGQLFVENRVPLSHITGEEGAEGTSDTIIVAEEELVVIDLKYGKGVLVDAEDNEQLQLYALGALELFGLAQDFKRVTMAISQPRVDQEPSVWSVPVEEVLAFGKRATRAAERAMQALAMEEDALPDDFFGPGPKACKFCKAKSKCRALNRIAEDTMDAAFSDLDKPAVEAKVIAVRQLPASTLAQKFAAIPLVELYLDAIKDAVRSEVETAGGESAELGYKLVAGRAGNRAWADEAAAEKYIRKNLRLKIDEAFDYKLKSPTKILEAIGDSPDFSDLKKRRLEELITRADGKPTLVKITDKRPALRLTPADAMFSAEAPGDDLV